MPLTSPIVHDKLEHIEIRRSPVIYLPYKGLVRIEVKGYAAEQTLICHIKSCGTCRSPV